MGEKLTVGELVEKLEKYDDDVGVWVARGGATTNARSLTYSSGGSWGEHITIQG